MLLLLLLVVMLLLMLVLVLGRAHGVDRAHRWGSVLGEAGVGVGGEGGRIRLLGFGELLKQGLRRIELERQGGLVDGDGGGLLAHLLALQVAFQRVEEEAVVGDAVPVEDLLLLLGADAVVLVEQVEKGALGLLERRVGA